MAKKVTTTFTCDEDILKWLEKVRDEIGCNKSELISTCILLSLDSVRSYSWLTKRLEYKDRTIQ